MAVLPSGLGVLVTRPVEQSEGLCRLIDGAGGRAIRAPLLEIVPAKNDSDLSRRLGRLENLDWLIFVSANAVRCAFELLGSQWLHISGPKIAAIGQATARELAERGVTVDLKPIQQFNSESLLAQSEWANIAGQRFLIVRGKGGRELLAETLRERGGEVEYAEVYRRIPPNIDEERLFSRWREGEIAVVTLTSGEALDNLESITPASDRELFLKTPMVVIGERLAKRAHELGYEHVFAADASDAEIFDAVVRIARELQSKHTNLRG